MRDNGTVKVMEFKGVRINNETDSETRQADFSELIGAFYEVRSRGAKHTSSKAHDIKITKKDIEGPMRTHFVI